MLSNHLLVEHEEEEVVGGQTDSDTHKAKRRRVLKEKMMEWNNKRQLSIYWLFYQQKMNLIKLQYWRFDTIFWDFIVKMVNLSQK